MTESAAAQFARIMPEDEGYSSLAAHEDVVYGGWPIWSLSSREQSAAEWLEAHDEDGHDYTDYRAAEGHYDEADDE